MSPYNRPPLRWLGGKFRHLPAIARHIPANTTRTIEPFAGSMAFSFNLGRGKAIVNDINHDVIALYRHMRSHRHLLRAELQSLFVRSNNTKDAYLALRDEFNSTTTNALRKSALFLYLNKHCWGGKTGYTRTGKFNTPFAAFKKQSCLPVKALGLFAKRCKGYTFLPDDFVPIIDMAGRGDCVYCDPPFCDSSNGHSFVHYTKDGFKRGLHQVLVDQALAASKRGATVIISNHYTSETQKLYSRASEVEVFDVRRLISCRSVDDALSVKECLAVYRPTRSRHRHG